MARLKRVVAVGFPHHIVHRGHNRGQLFFDDQDRLDYLNLLKEYKQKWQSSFLAYCLMTNHVHLLAMPNQPVSLWKMMHAVALRFTRRINRKYGRTGGLWEGRYRSFIVGEDPYLWTVMRYIDLNPCRAGIVKRPEEYPYSSAKAHIHGVRDDLLDMNFFSQWLADDYAQFVSQEVSETELKEIRSSVNNSRPLGSEKFNKSIEERLSCEFVRERRGRPRRAGS